MRSRWIVSLLVAWAVVVASSTLWAVDVQHVDIYRKPGRFGGWPANHGMWNWGNEILVGFGAGYYKDNGPTFHAIDHDKPEEHLLARSLDGGLTWTIENPAEQGALIPRGKALHGTELPRVVDKPWIDCPGGIDFTHPDFCMTLRMNDTNSGTSRFFCSTDRGHHWNGPFKFPMLGQKGIAARTDYIVNSKDDCLVFLTAAKTNGKEGRPLCARTVDGGKSWNFISWIAPEPAGYAIMPSTVRVGPKELLSTIRLREGDKSWIDAYYSPDDGEHWESRGRPVPDTGEGNPPAIVRLTDGRLCLTYGVRKEPYGMYARISRDNGLTWGPEFNIRDKGGNRDLGYPRSVVRPDGKVVTTYYYNDDHKKDRYIAATIWDPDTAEK